MTTPLEFQAVQAANAFKKLIATIRALDNTTLSDTRAIFQMSKDFRHGLQVNARVLLVDIFTEAVLQNHAEITNYYYLYFLQQATRFNQFFNVIEPIISEKDADAVTAGHEVSLADQLRNANITPITHPLLMKSAPTRMRVVLKKRKENTFREHYLDTDFRKYYNEKTTAEDEKHQDHDHYYKANIRIGSATQQSNFLRLFSSSLRQPRDDYFKPADAEKHKLEKELYASAISYIQAGMDLSSEEINVLANGEYYRYPMPQCFSVPNESFGNYTNTEVPKDLVTHLGHASELIYMHGRSNLMVAIDPVNYQSGTESFIVKWGATLAYPRKTSAALATNDYPATQVVLLTHNHHDHMCLQSLTEAFSPRNTLFIVPQGDARRLQAQGLENVIEFSSWNDYAEITLTDERGEETKFIINSFPAKHASNRFTNDLFKCLYMGFMLRNEEKKGLILCTGDTGVLDDEHYQQLETYLLNEKLYIDKACIASGPDRPRSWMECTHQSTADAITMHAKLNVMNIKAFAQESNIQSLEKLSYHMISEKAIVDAIGYHQGCFRLGLLSLQDVRTTVLRMLAVLKTLPNIPLTQVSEEELGKNLFYNFMDTFEQKALYQTILCYRELKILSLDNIADIIMRSFFIPQPGRSWNKREGIQFDYERLIQNRDPLSNTNQLINKPYEFFALEIDPSLYGRLNVKSLIRHAFEAYMNRTLSMTSGKSKKLKAFLTRLDTMENCSFELGKLYADIFPKQDEGIRDEGHVHTMLTILAGLIHFPEFRQQFYTRHQSLQADYVDLPQASFAP